ncbi:MAG: type I methionyl aminopeptidase [Patescibacteria group bacterium]
MSKTTVKTKKELELMKVSGKICAQALKKVLENVKPGVTCRQLDIIARQEIEKKGASPSFMTVDGYQHTICTTINEQVVHGIPTGRKLEDGDILGIDIGALYNGYHSDLAISVPVGNVSKDKQEFLEAGKNTLKAALLAAKPGNHIGDISSVIQKGIEGAGYSIVKNLTGHGVGRQLHEEPMIPGFGKNGTGPKIQENMTLAIEVIYTQGSGEVGVEKDSWTISSTDGSLGGLFEQTVAIQKSGPIVLTPYL